MPQQTNLSLDSYIKLMESKLEVAMRSLRKIHQDGNHQRKLEAEYALVQIRQLDDAAQ